MNEKKYDISKKTKHVEKGELIPWKVIDELAPPGHSDIKIEISFKKRPNH